jgi:Cytidylate kinase-like family
MPVITIGREFGAGGETVGRLVAERLKIDYLDSKIVDEVARRLKFGAEVVENYDEKTGGLLDRILRQLATVDFSTPHDVAVWTPPYGDLAWDPQVGPRHFAGDHPQTGSDRKQCDRRPGRRLHPPRRR